MVLAALCSLEIICERVDPVMPFVSVECADFMYIACAHARSEVSSSKYTNLRSGKQATQYYSYTCIYPLLFPISCAVTGVLLVYFPPFFVVRPSFLRIDSSRLDN